ncbi:TPA: DNA-binding protein [Proteus mirabilis]|nr:DNA-binding protein [Proteus mirabilis]
MALVSVTEAARLTGKNRATIHRYIKQGKLSQISDATNTKKLDTSELIRVFGSLTATPATLLQNDAMQHDTTPKTDQSVALLQQKIALLEQLLESKNKELQRQDEHIDSLKQAMLLIESKLPTTSEPVAPAPAKKSWQFWKK